MALAESLEDIEIAFRHLEFSIRLLSYCELGKLNPHDFDDDHAIQLDHDYLHFPAGQVATKERIEQAAAIGVLLAAGGTAIALNRGFDEAGPNPDPTSADPIIRLRTLIYMVRSAYAHDIAAPCWEARGPFLRQLTVDLENGPMTVDLSTLHGHPFTVDQIGGYGNWYRIRRAATTYLASRIA